MPQRFGTAFDNATPARPMRLKSRASLPPRRKSSTARDDVADGMHVISNWLNAHAGPHVDRAETGNRRRIGFHCSTHHIHHQNPTNHSSDNVRRQAHALQSIDGSKIDLNRYLYPNLPRQTSSPTTSPFPVHSLTAPCTTACSLLVLESAC